MVMMAKLAIGSEVPSTRTAVTVMNSASGPALCPFFGKCDGVMVFDSASAVTQFYPNGERTAESMCKLLLDIRPHRLVCGFIAAPEKTKLRAAGVEVRLSSCTRAVVELVDRFCDLASA
jgi:hypothetical protein